MPSNNTNAFINAENIQWETVGNGIERKILGYDDEVMMVYIRFEKGAVGSLHHHVHRQVSFVASGRFEATIDGHKTILKQGDCFFCGARPGTWCCSVGERNIGRCFCPCQKRLYPVKIIL